MLLSSKQSNSFFSVGEQDKWTGRSGNYTMGSVQFSCNKSDKEDGCGLIVEWRWTSMKAEGGKM